MLYENWKGLKFPDEFLVRFFFKEGLTNTSGKVLELGCGNGNNLQLFYQYGHHVTGVDIDAASIKDAQDNFAELKHTYPQLPDACLITSDMRDFVAVQKESVDVLLMPSSLYYISQADATQVLNDCRRLLRRGSKFYLRMRDVHDYRYGKGSQVEPGSFCLDISETGEKGCLVHFYEPEEFIAQLKACWNPSRILSFSCVFDNFQNDQFVLNNSDFIVWGEI